MKNKPRRSKLRLMVISGILLALTSQVEAADFNVAGNTLRVQGFINQGVTYGIAGEHFDTQDGFQSAVFDALLEAQYEFGQDFMIYGAGQLTGDWAYDILNDNNEWESKQFDESREEIYLDTDLRDVLHELHFTWAPGDFLFRVGKQVVIWGETDGLRLLDVINPIDQRRGLGDVEFESTILPIWLARAEYYPPIDSSWLQDVGLEVVYNPNADFVANRRLVTGNDEGGIWAVDLDANLPPPPFGPGGTGKVGSFRRDTDTPDDWDSEAMEVGVRLKAVINDAIVSLNFFNGIDNDPVVQQKFVPNPLFPVGPPVVPQVDVEVVEGNFVVHPYVTETYERFRFVGATFSRDFPFLSVSGLGGVAPVLRLEGMYAFDTTFYDKDLVTTTESDEIRYSIGIDWKAKINWLNPRAYFFISGQYFNRHLSDYPDGFKLATVSEGGKIEKDNHTTSLLITTSYFHQKLVPSFFWLRDWTRGNSDLFKVQLTYERSSSWQYTIGALFLDGDENNEGFEALKHKDQVYATMSYRF